MTLAAPLALVMFASAALAARTLLAAFAAAVPDMPPMASSTCGASHEECRQARDGEEPERETLNPMHRDTPHHQ